MRTGATVKDIAKDMQTVYDKPLYKIAESRNKMAGTSCTDYSVDNDLQIGLFILVVVTLVQKFLNDIHILFGEALAHL